MANEKNDSIVDLHVPLDINIKIDDLFTRWRNRYIEHYKREPNTYYSFRAGYILSNLHREDK
jgi:hypothetical protein